MAAVQQLSPAYPLGSRLDERGVLQIAGCDALELAREFGTPCYVVSEDDLRARARAFRTAFESRAPGAEVLFASKAFPCTAVLRIAREEGLGVDVASGGELTLALAAGFEPARVYLHGNAKSIAELELALDRGVGQIVIDNDVEIDRLERLVGERGATQRVLIRVTPDVRGRTHASISTGQADSKFGFSMDAARAAIERLRGSERLELIGLHAHIGSQLLDLAPFRAAIEALAELGDFPLYDVGGGLGVAYTDEEPPSIEEYAAAKVDAVHELLGPDKRIVAEPGRALVGNSTVTLYGVQSVKRNVSTWVGVDGGMSDNLRPMLYGSVYEAEVVGRFGGTTPCRLAGKHCESGDVIVREAMLDDPHPGDVIVTPATGAYGHALANNYNGVPRPPVVMCRDGDARVVVRRESYEDLLARDA